MCGIAGMLSLEATENTLQQMLKTMAHRGPDENGVYRDQDCALLHSRLAIIDPAGGSQPMRLNRHGKKFILVYNGELYNTGELRKELSALGHSFQGHSDTEVLLHAYSQWGEACLGRINGIYAFAVWEPETKKLFLARDRIGVKPLFFSRCGKGLLFASEIKTLLCHPQVKPVLDETGAMQLIMLGPGRLPGSGVLRGIEEIRPGHCAIYQDGSLRIKRYWKLQDREHTQSLEETAEQIRYLVTDSIERQMVSDVPIGTFLSGGLDSSIITSVCARKMRSRGERLRTFSVDYLNNSRFFTPNKFQPDGDDAYIEIMREAEDTNHSKTVLTSQMLISELEAATCARDLPGMADVDFSLLAFCRRIRRDVKVGLSGECADEIFGGYPWYRDPEIRNKAGFPWAQNTAQRAKLLNPIPGMDPEAFVMDAYRATCADADVLPGTDPRERRMKEMVNLNFEWFMQTLLERKDRMSMYTSLEVRVPFCDYRIAEYLYGIPWELKDHRGREKGLLRLAMEGLLPEQVLYRKKSPYPKTFDPAYETMAEERLEEILEEPEAPLFHLIRREAVESIIDRNTPWPWYGQLMRRPQTIAYLLQIDFWLRHYGVAMAF